MLQEQIVEKYPSIDTFSKGINQSVNEQLISIDEAIVANNVDISDGGLKTCKGYQRAFKSTLPTGSKVLMRHYTDGNSDLLVAIGKDIYKHNRKDDSFSKIYTRSTNHKYTFINYQIDLDEITVLTNGVDDVLVYDGSKFRPLKNDGRDSDEDENQENGEPNRAPKGKYISLHKERLWISGNKDNPNRVYFSQDFDIDNWTFPVDDIEANTKGGFIDIPTWDGGVIIGMKSLFDDVVIFKNKNVFRVFGTYPGNYNLIQVFDTVDGDILHKTITSLENTAIWTSTEGIHLFNGVNSEIISTKIQDIFDDINIDEAHNSVAVIHDRKYILSIPTGDSKTNNLIIEYNMDTGAFVTKTSIDVDSFLDMDDELYFTNNYGHIFEYNKGNDFNGSSIDMKWESGNNSYDEQQARKILNRIYFQARGTGQMKITSVSERKSVERIIDLEEDFQFYRQRLRNKGRFLKFIIENVDGSEVEMREFQYMLDLDYD